MKRFFKNLWLFISGRSGSVQLDFIRVFALSKLDDLFGVKINLEDRKIDLKVTTKKTKARKIFGKKIVEKFTSDGGVRFRNRLVATRLAWKSISDTEAEIFLQRLKNPTEGNIPAGFEWVLDD